jgi:hypothetical protein
VLLKTSGGAPSSSHQQSFPSDWNVFLFRGCVYTQILYERKDKKGRKKRGEPTFFELFFDVITTTSSSLFLGE